MYQTSQNSGLVRNSTQCRFGVEWVVFCGEKHKIFFSFMGEFRLAEDRTIQSISLLQRFLLSYRRKIPVFSIYRVSIHIHNIDTMLPWRSCSECPFCNTQMHPCSHFCSQVWLIDYSEIVAWIKLKFSHSVTESPIFTTTSVKPV